MTILEDLKSGRLVVVPREAEQRMLEAAGRYADGCAIHNYGAPPDADGTWDAMIAASPDHTAGLVALVEGMGSRAEKAEQNASFWESIANAERDDRKSAEARALAAEAEVVRLKARIADLEERHYAD